MTNLTDFLKRATGRIAVGFLIVLAIGGLAACDPSESWQYQDTSSVATAEAYSSTGTDAVTADAGGNTSPLLALLGTPLDSDEAVNDFYIERHVAVGQLTEQCMTAAGFEYVQTDYSNLSEMGDALMVDTLEFKEEFGFGIATLDDPAHSPGLIAEWDDPNSDYIDSLSALDRDAFYTTLRGDYEAEESTGCYNEAFDEVFAFEKVFEDFGFSYEGRAAAIEADPRILEAEANWAVCMAEMGYPFADQAAAEASINAELNALLTVRDSFDDEGNATPATLRQIEEIHAYERATAVAGWECDGPRRDLVPTIEIEYEQAVVDLHGESIRQALAD